MKLLITSDAHGRFDLLRKVHAKHNDVLHHIDAGDLMLSVKELETLNLIAVKGNSDHYLDLPKIQLINLENLDILVVHGHEHNVKYGLEQLIKVAESYDVDLCIYGHTHQKQMIVHKGITYLNPGAISGFNGSYCLYENGKITFYEV
ncbi:metallophosphoesterase family protein [Paracholeplasma brassicae]|nr:YfcE family phosphodiesterase [Paracholeplasma brassicae]